MSPRSRVHPQPPLWLLPLLVVGGIAVVALLLPVAAALGGGLGLGIGLAAGGWIVYRLQGKADAYLRDHDRD